MQGLYVITCFFFCLFFWCVFWEGSFSPSGFVPQIRESTLIPMGIVKTENYLEGVEIFPSKMQTIAPKAIL